jgi:hypothetical protein
VDEAIDKRVDEVIGDVEMGRVGVPRMKKLRDACSQKLPEEVSTPPIPNRDVGVHRAIRNLGKQGG